MAVSVGTNLYTDSLIDSVKLMLISESSSKIIASVTVKVKDFSIPVWLVAVSVTVPSLIPFIFTSELETVSKVANKINIIIDEIYSNIVNYSKANLAEIGYSIENGKMFLYFIDNGLPYNPLEIGDPDITLSVDERDIGGLGIFIVKKMADTVEYKYEENRNILKVLIALN